MAQQNSLGEVIKLGAIAVGAYFLWQYFMGSSASATPVAAPATPSTPTGSTAPITVQSLAAAASVPNESWTASALITAAGGVNSLNVDQWNYYWQQLTGSAVTAADTGSIEAAAGGDNPMNADAYLKARGAAGLATTLTQQQAATPAATPAAVPAVVSYLLANPYPVGSMQWGIYNSQAPNAPTAVAGLGDARPVPVPMVFAYGAGGRPVLLMPGTARAA